MRNEIVLSAKEAKPSAIGMWLKRENVLFSSIMEERVSNRQALLIAQALTSFCLLTCTVFLHWLAALACLGWFIVSLSLAKKGGLR